MNLNIDLTVLMADGEERELRFNVDYFPGDPGKCWGLPENCYPPEPAELDICEIIGAAGESHDESELGDPEATIDRLMGKADEIYLYLSKGEW